MIIFSLFINQSIIPRSKDPSFEFITSINKLDWFIYFFFIFFVTNFVDFLSRQFISISLLTPSCILFATTSPSSADYCSKHQPPHSPSQHFSRIFVDLQRKVHQKPHFSSFCFLFLILRKLSMKLVLKTALIPMFFLSSW